MTHEHDEDCDCNNGMSDIIAHKWAALCSRLFEDKKIDEGSPIYERTLTLFKDMATAEAEMMAVLNNKLVELIQEHEMHLIKTGKEAVH